MAESLSRPAHALGSAIAFFLFAAAVIPLSLLVFPLLYLLPSSRHTRELRAQRIVQWTFRCYCAALSALRVASVRVEGVERLRAPGPYVVISNHPTLLDVVILGSLRAQLDCVAKRSAWSNPFMAGVIRATGYLPNDAGPLLVDACTARLRAGRSLLIFPEGTRSPAGDLHPFRRGFAHVALRATAPILPVCIRCDPPALGKERRWWQMPNETLRYTIEIGEAIDPGGLVPQHGGRGATARRVTAALRDFYLKKLHYTPG
ncbi:MAG: lysophospholipid acyltransferase family protein [Myxococcota bacterium]|nr:lysophospholipid acyltransferase family protein [Myxococcota bacterium]